MQPGLSYLEGSSRGRIRFYWNVNLTLLLLFFFFHTVRNQEFKECSKGMRSQRQQLAFSHTATPFFFPRIRHQHSACVSYLQDFRGYSIYLLEELLRGKALACNIKSKLPLFSILAFHSNYVYIPAQEPRCFHIYCKTRRQRSW